jgi:predicted transport protein
MTKSIDDQIAKMEANIREKTGRSVAEWVNLLKQSALEKHGQMVKLLKSDHGFTYGYANLVAHKALQSSAEHHADDDLVASQYAGPKASLKPIYDAVIKTVSSFGGDMEVAPKKAYVSLRRKKQFALVQPSTKTRVDLGINLKGKDPEGRLEASGSFNAMVSHRVRLESTNDFSAEVKAWLKQAYDSAG